MFDDLANHFGEHTVFMDVAAIEAGRDFRKAIEEGVTKCGVLLVVIGPEWLEAKDERGTRRLTDSSDFVRIETASALRRDIPVIPVLVRGADFRFQPIGGQAEAASGPTQFGLSFNDWGDRFAKERIAMFFGPGRHGPGNNLFFMVTDPDGNKLELSAELETMLPGQAPRVWPNTGYTLNTWGQAWIRT